MNKETVITETMVKEFLSDLNPFVLDAWLSFKKSYQPPSDEWEVVEYEYGTDHHTNLMEDTSKIKQVRRLSDKATLEVGKEYEIEFKHAGKRSGQIHHFELQSRGIFVYFQDPGCGYLLDNNTSIKKHNQVLFTTLDGKEIREGDRFWYIYADDNSISEIFATKSMIAKRPTYSTKEIAEQHVCNLSLAMIREALSTNAFYNTVNIATIARHIQEGLSKLKTKDQ